MPTNKPGIEDISIHYAARDAAKPAVVFVHGNSQNSSCGRGLLSFFADRGHSTLSYDLPGHGNSPWKAFSYGFDDLVALNCAVIRHFDLNRPLLIGHSLGGMIQAATAIELEFEPSGLILCGSLDCDPIAAAKSLNIENLSYLTESLNDYLTDAAGLFRQQKYYDYFANRHLDDLFIEIINRRYSHPEAIKLNFKALATYNVRQQLAQLSIPILVIHGTAEKVIPPDLVVDMASQHARMVVEWLPEGGHNGFYQQHQDTIEILQRYYSWLVSSSEPESRG